jgi:hypothetical protein
VEQQLDWIAEFDDPIVSVVSGAERVQKCFASS